MSRNNNVRGPTSALTEFLRESGISATSVANRRAAVPVPPPEPEQEPEDAEAPEEQNEEPEPSPRRARRGRGRTSGYNSDELDEPPTPAKKQKTTTAAETKKAATAKAKGKGKGKKGKKDDDEDDEEDAYTALSKSLWSNQGASSSKPPNGSFDNCAKCGERYTVTKYTIPAVPGPGYLCHACAKSGNVDPFKKPAPKRRKTATDRRTVTHYEERLFPSLASLCIEVVSRHLSDIEAFGDIGTLNMQSISKAISKNRSLSSENAHLLYGAENTTLTLYDATKLNVNALTTLAHLNPNLTTLRLDFCGLLTDAVMSAWSNSLPNLVSLQLLGPFLVRPAGWIEFFNSHSQLESFYITQSPRFDLECLNSLLETSGVTLRKLGLKEVGQISDEFLQSIESLSGGLTFLDISDPSQPCSDDALINMLAKIGPTLTHLNISGHHTVSDDVLIRGVQPNVQKLTSLAVSRLGELTNDGVASFFSGWTDNPPLTSLDISRIPSLSNEALLALLEHSGRSLQELNLNGWKIVESVALEQIGVQAPELRVVDFGFCRNVDDFILKGLIEKNNGVIKEIKVWGCNRVEGKWSLSGNKHENLRIYGIESFN